MSEKNDIKSINAILSQVELLVISGKQVFDDGKINMNDLPTAMMLLGNMATMIEAFMELPEAWDEAKDVDSEEAIQLVKRFIEMGKAIKEA